MDGAVHRDARKIAEARMGHQRTRSRVGRMSLRIYVCYSCYLHYTHSVFTAYVVVKPECVCPCVFRCYFITVSYFSMSSSTALPALGDLHDKIADIIKYNKKLHYLVIRQSTVCSTVVAALNRARTSMTSNDEQLAELLKLYDYFSNKEYQKLREEVESATKIFEEAEKVTRPVPVRPLRPNFNGDNLIEFFVVEEDAETTESAPGTEVKATDSPDEFSDEYADGHANDDDRINLENDSVDNYIRGEDDIEIIPILGNIIFK